MRSSLARTALLLAPALAATLAVGFGTAPRARAGHRTQDSSQEAAQALGATLARAGITLDAARGLVSLPVSVQVRDDLLEYLLVGPRGQGHESLFGTEVRPSLLNAALLAVGAEPGRNATWTTPGEGEGEPELELPAGDGFLLYAAWREGEETFLYRVDDLLANLRTGRSMRRHRWVFLGSRFARLRDDEPEVYVADVEQNLINVSFFFQGNTLLTPAVPDCIEQTIWVANSWLVPPRDERVELIFARAPLASLPADWEARLPVVERRVEEQPVPGDGADGR